MTLTPTAITADSFIRYDARSKDYAVYASAEIIGYSKTFHDAEQLRTAYLAERLSHFAGDSVATDDPARRVQGTTVGRAPTFAIPEEDDPPLPNPIDEDKDPPQVVRL